MKNKLYIMFGLLVVICRTIVTGEGMYNATPNNSITLGKDVRPYAAYTGDVNNDKIKDIIVCNYKHGDVDGSVLLFCQKKGRFLSKESFSIPISEPRGIVVKDIDNDNRNDIIITELQKSLHICYARNRFKPKTFKDTNMYSAGLLEVNLNSSISDKLSASLLGRAVWWRVAKNGKVTQTYIARPPYNQSEFPAAGDLDGDGELDLVYPYNDVMFIYYGPFTACDILSPQMLFKYKKIKIKGLKGNIQNICIGDFNHDFRPDIVGCVPGDGIIFITQSAPLGYNSNEVSFRILGDFSQIKVADINNDKLDDIVAIDNNSHYVRIFLQKRGGGFVDDYKDAEQVIKERAYNILLDDINSDNKIDLIVTTTYSSINIYHKL